MREFTKKHSYHLALLFVLLFISSISGWYGYTGGTAESESAVQEVKPEGQAADTEEKATYARKTEEAAPAQADVIENNIDGRGAVQENEKFAAVSILGKEYPLLSDGKTSLYEAMRTADEASDFDFSGRDYGGSLGFFVTEINGVKNDARAGTYWIYYINREKAQAGISNYVIQKGDIIEWKYENAQ